MSDEHDTRRASEIEDTRQVKKDGQWRRVTDKVDKATYIARRKSPKGFYRGARVSRAHP